MVDQLKQKEMKMLYAKKCSQLVLYAKYIDLKGVMLIIFTLLSLLFNFFTSSTIRTV